MRQEKKGKNRGCSTIIQITKRTARQTISHEPPYTNRQAAAGRSKEASKAAGMAKGMGGKFVGGFIFHIDASASPSAYHKSLSYKKLCKKLVVKK
jgi:hypothetical protein